jgi:hypothetical protein
MKKDNNKPSPEAKALSLYLMAFKSTSPTIKDKSQRINRLWSLVKSDKLSNSDYLLEVQNMLTSYGGYSQVVAKTVKHYIDKTGEWTLKGDDQYCQDAKQIADKILSK